MRSVEGKERRLRGFLRSWELRGEALWWGRFPDLLRGGYTSVRYLSWSSLRTVPAGHEADRVISSTANKIHRHHAQLLSKL